MVVEHWKFYIYEEQVDIQEKYIINKKIKYNNIIKILWLF